MRIALLRSLLPVVLTAAVATAEEPPRGTARLEVTIARSSPTGASSSVVTFLVPIDGKSHDFRSGRQIPIQTKVNSIPTISYVDAATSVGATITAYASGETQYILMEGALHDVHVIQQLGIPFALAEAALLDTTRCRGTWLMTNGGSRPLCSWSRRGAKRVESTVTAKLVWVAEGFRGAPLDLRRTSTTEATTRIATGASERHQSISCDALSPAPVACESLSGKDVPLVLNAAGTKTTTYLNAGTNIRLAIDAEGDTSVVMGDSGLEPPPDITHIDFTQLRSTRGMYQVPASTTAIDRLTVTRLAKSHEGEVTVNLERYRRIAPASGAR